MLALCFAPKEAAVAIRARFKPTPEGEFHVGIPARDLDDDDLDALDNDQRALVRKSPLYDYRPERDTTAARTATTPADAEEGKG